MSRMTTRKKTSSSSSDIYDIALTLRLLASGIELDLRVFPVCASWLQGFSS